MGDGPINAKAMVVGEAPGLRETVLQKNFCGKAGQRLEAAFYKAGLDRSDLYITNSCKCHPEKNATPRPKEIKACRPYLETELRTIKPKTILLLGNTALKSFKIRGGITDNRGKVLTINNTNYMLAFHPAAILRDPGKSEVFDADIQKFASLIKDGVSPAPRVEWNLVTDNTSEFFKDFEQADRFAFDLETTSLNWFDPEQRVNLMQIATPTTVWIFPIHRMSSPHDLINKITTASQGKVAVAHNGKFDNLWLLSHYGTSFYLTFDTMLAHHLIDENTPQDLEYLARTYLGVPAWDIDVKLKHTPTDQTLEYAAKDARYTLNLYEHFQDKLRKNFRLRKLFYNLVMPAARAILWAETVGHYIDEEKRQTARIQILSDRNRLSRELKKLAHNPNINLNSPQQVGSLLFKTLRITPKHFTDTGAPSTSESTLKELAHKYSFCKKLLEYREKQKMLSTYIDGWEQLRHDDHIYFSTKLHGTVTGRWSSRLHQTPREPLIRQLITAPDDWIFVSADFSQIELRIAAEFAHERTMLKIFNEGGDIHWETMLEVIPGDSQEENQALTLTGKPTLFEALKALHDIDPKLHFYWKEKRKAAKAINFGFIYGMGAPKFKIYAIDKYDVIITLIEAKKTRRAYFNKYHDLPAWHERERNYVREYGYVINPVGRYRHLPQIYSMNEGLRAEAGRHAINSRVQGFATDLKALALIEISETFKRSDLLIKGEVHDSILMWIKRYKLHELVPRIKKIMESPHLLLSKFGIQLDVPLIADVEIGPWGNGKTYSKDLVV